MSFMQQIHIVDSDVRRRAEIAFALSNRGYRTHVYEDLCELERFRLSNGIVLLNSDDGGSSLPSLKEKLGASGQCLPIAIYTTKPDARQAVEAILAGAIDYLEWPIAGDAGVALEQVSTRAAESHRLEKRRSDAAILVRRLSEREREVLTLLIAGHSNKSIAQLLSLSPRTVEIHRANLMKKLEADSTACAVRIGIYAGLDD